MHDELVKKSQNIEWEYTAKAVTSWGGMRMMKELVEGMQSIGNHRKLLGMRMGGRSKIQPYGNSKVR